MARLDPVNKPELLPAEFTTVIDVAGFLTPREEAEIAKKIERLEKDTGFKLRVLAQNYPETPGLAIRCAPWPFRPPHPCRSYLVVNQYPRERFVYVHSCPRDSCRADASRVVLASPCHCMFRGAFTPLTRGGRW
jgi:hypothetical protein